METQTFTGMGFNFQAHDAFATESQGPVQDRTARAPGLLGQGDRGGAQIAFERHQRRAARPRAAACGSRCQGERFSQPAW